MWKQHHGDVAGRKFSNKVAHVLAYELKSNTTTIKSLDLSRACIRLTYVCIVYFCFCVSAHHFECECSISVTQHRQQHRQSRMDSRLFALRPNKAIKSLNLQCLFASFNDHSFMMKSLQIALLTMKSRDSLQKHWRQTIRWHHCSWNVWETNLLRQLW